MNSFKLFILFISMTVAAAEPERRFFCKADSCLKRVMDAADAKKDHIALRRQFKCIGPHRERSPLRYPLASNVKRQEKLIANGWFVAEACVDKT